MDFFWKQVVTKNVCHDSSVALGSSRAARDTQCVFYTTGFLFDIFHAASCVHAQVEAFPLVHAGSPRHPLPGRPGSDSDTRCLCSTSFSHSMSPWDTLSSCRAEIEGYPCNGGAPLPGVRGQHDHFPLLSCLKHNHVVEKVKRKMFPPIDVLCR